MQLTGYMNDWDSRQFSETFNISMYVLLYHLANTGEKILHGLNPVDEVFNCTKYGFAAEWFSNKLIDALLISPIPVVTRIMSRDHHYLHGRVYFSDLINKIYSESIRQMIIKENDRMMTLLKHSLRFAD